jgi:hypothetical protein
MNNQSLSKQVRERCTCSLRIRLVGDGCDWCNFADKILVLEQKLYDCESRNAALEKGHDRLRDKLTTLEEERNRLRAAVRRYVAIRNKGTAPSFRPTAVDVQELHEAYLSLAALGGDDE